MNKKVAKIRLPKKTIPAFFIPVLSAVIISFISRYTFFAPIFDQFENAFRDMRSQYRAVSLNRNFPPIVILNIDSRSIYKLGKMANWPRAYFAQVVEYVSAGGANAVIFDIIFDRGTDVKGDSIFARAVENSGNVYFALIFSNADSENFLYAMKEEPKGFADNKFYYCLPKDRTRNFWSEPRLDNDFFNLINRSAGVGFANSVPDRDGVVRSAQLLLNFNGHLYPSLPISVLLKILDIDSQGVGFNEKGDLRLSSKQGNQYDIPLNSEGGFLIDYLGGFETFRYISFYDVLEKRVPAEYFQGKVVFVGSSAPGMFDLKSVPVQRNFPGVEIHANVLADILNGYFIWDIDPTSAFIILILLCFLSTFSGLWLKTWQSITIMVVISLGYIVGSFHYFALKGIFLEMFRPGGAFFFAYLSSMIYKYVAEERDKRFISNAFSHFLDKAVIREILADPSKLKLGGERREVTILFNDIRDFTSISEKIQPEQLSEFLNIHLTEMTNIVFHNGGLLDKYIGDAVVALFGAPVARVDHAKMGAKTALEMVRVVKRIRDQFQGTPMENLRIGVGVNTGIVSVGNMGSSYRFNYTAIGDEMNLGARLEGLNKLYGTNIIVSQSTVKFLDDSFILRELDFVQVKGKSEPVGIYQLFDAEEDLQQEVIELYHQGLIAYCGCDWEMAASKFHQVLKLSANDKPSKLMLDRVLYLKDHPPGKYWSGVWKIESK